jgi:hypothetical protein
MAESKESRGKKSKYQVKKQSQKGGSYQGNSPFFVNIPAYQYDKPLEFYPHLKEMEKTLNFRIS